MRNRAVIASLRFLVVLLFAGGAAPVFSQTIKAGDTPVLPMLTTVDGRKLTYEHLQGKAIVFAYFASTCPFCMIEAPKLEKLHRENAKWLTVVGVNIEDKDPQQKEKTIQWVNKYKLSHPVTTDVRLLDPVLGKPKGIPALYVFDAQGRFNRFEIGEMLDEDFDELARFARGK
ncbi:MAG: TlpA family protein disulfide reductase [Burkholderiaceae bacterium]